MLKRTVAPSSVRKLLRAVSAALLLALYVAGNTQVGFLHQLLHNEEAANHSAVQEKDPCHRSVYHGESSSCKHEYHLVKVNTCSFCHTLTSIDQIIFSSTEKMHKYYSLRTSVTVHQVVSDSEVHLFLSRAPPVSQSL